MRRALYTLVLIASFAPRVAAEGQATGGPEKSLRALRITTPIQVDGRLEEAVWGQAPVIADFVQQEPRVGEPSSERTEVRVLIDEEALYIGVWCFDADGGGVIARELRRDQARNFA